MNTKDGYHRLQAFTLTPMYRNRAAELARQIHFLEPLSRRINSRLIKQGQKLRKARAFTVDLGDYFVIDVSSNTVIRTHVDVPGLARELGISF